MNLKAIKNISGLSEEKIYIGTENISHFKKERNYTRIYLKSATGESQKGILVKETPEKVLSIIQSNKKD